MNGTAFLQDYSHIKRVILLQVIKRKTSYSGRELMFNTLAMKNEFTTEQLNILSALTGLTTSQILNYERGGNTKDWKGAYKGIIYEFDSRTFEVTFRKLDWQVVGSAKVDPIISLKDLETLVKKKIDNREIF